MQSQQNNIKKRISPNLAAVIGALVLMLGGFFLSYSYIQTKKIKTYDMMAHYIYKEENNFMSNSENIKQNIDLKNSMLRKEIGFLLEKHLKIM